MYAGGFEVGAHVVIVVAPNVMCQFVTQDIPNILVAPEPVILVGTDTEFDRLPPVYIQTQQPWVLVRSKFRQ